jgi:hypothetical protein
VGLCAGVKTEAAEQEAIIPGLGGGKDASSPFATALERILDKVGVSDPTFVVLLSHYVIVSPHHHRMILSVAHRILMIGKLAWAN